MRSPARLTRRMAPGLFAVGLLLGASASVTAVPPARTVNPASDGLAVEASTPSLARLALGPVVGRPDGGQPAFRVAAHASPAQQPKAVGRAGIGKSTLTGGAESGGTSSAGYRGRNHAWFPSLGISRDLTWYPCSRTSRPGNGLYRWGCAGRNNIYLFAHAATTFEPLHDAYVRGRLRKGMPVVYADARGRLITYRVRYWRVVSPSGQAWAYAAQARPTMTLQTCVGARSQYRLVVRLTPG